MRLDFQHIVIKQFLPDHLCRHPQINLIVVRSCDFASLVSLGLRRFSDIDFMTEKFGTLGSVCYESLFI